MLLGKCAPILALDVLQIAEDSFTHICGPEVR